VEPARLNKLVGDLDRLGFQLHFHTIGDGAVRAALDALEAAQRTNGVRDSRHIISHVQLIDPADIARLPRLGVIASMTPAWSRGDDLNRAFAAPRLGPERARWLYPHRSILAAGGRLAWGTDWPVTTLVPLEGLETAVTRRYNGGRDPEGKPDTAWIPQECLSLEQAIAAYTLGAAHACFWKRTGVRWKRANGPTWWCWKKTCSKSPPWKFTPCRWITPLRKARWCTNGSKRDHPRPLLDANCCLPRPGQRNDDVLVVLADGYGPHPVGAAGATGEDGAEHEQGQQKMNGSQTQDRHGTGKL
jgi:hypothetical protein